MKLRFVNLFFIIILFTLPLITQEKPSPKKWDDSNQIVVTGYNMDNKIGIPFITVYQKGKSNKIFTPLKNNGVE